MGFHNKFSGKMCTLLLVTAMCGCQLSPYEEPKNGPRTTIKFINDSVHPMTVQMYEDPNECTNRHKVGAVEHGIPKIVGVQADRRMVFTASIQDSGKNTADKQKALMAVGGVVGVVAAAGVAIASSTNTCLPTIDFVPKEGTKYILKMSVEDGACKYLFKEDSLGDRQFGNFTVREWTRPLGEAGPFCKKL